MRKGASTKGQVAIEYTSPVLAGRPLNGEEKVLNTDRIGWPRETANRTFELVIEL